MRDIPTALGQSFEGTPGNGLWGLCDSIFSIAMRRRSVAASRPQRYHAACVLGADDIILVFFVNVNQLRTR